MKVVLDLISKHLEDGSRIQLSRCLLANFQVFGKQIKHSSNVM